EIGCMGCEMTPDICSPPPPEISESSALGRAADLRDQDSPKGAEQRARQSAALTRQLRGAEQNARDAADQSGRNAPAESSHDAAENQTQHGPLRGSEKNTGERSGQGSQHDAHVPQLPL